MNVGVIQRFQLSGTVTYICKHLALDFFDFSIVVLIFRREKERSLFSLYAYSYSDESQSMWNKNTFKNTNSSLPDMTFSVVKQLIFNSSYAQNFNVIKSICLLSCKTLQ